MGKLSLEEIRERQREAGRARRGPHALVGEGDRVSDAGYKVPGRYKGSRHLERNRDIVARAAEGETLEEIAERYGINPKTVEHVIRYFTEDEEEATA